MMKDTFIVRDTPYPLQFLYYGTLFSAGAEITLSGNATYYQQGKTGSDLLIHFMSRTMAHNGTDVTIEQYINPTLTANGTTLLTITNQNHQSSRTASFTIYTDPPAPTSDGTLVARDRVFGTVGGVGVGAVAASTLSTSGIERLLDKSTDYVLKFINNTTATTTVILGLMWYESGN